MVHEEYELVFSATGCIEEKGAPHLKQNGIVKVIQGPKQIQVHTLDDATMVYAFLSVNDINIPLLPDQKAEKLSPTSFKLRIPSHEFIVTLENNTPDELLTEFEKIISWFCKYEGEPAGNTGRLSQRFERAGDQGVAMVEQFASKVEISLNDRIQPHVNAARECETKNINIGGKATASVLGTTRKVVGAGAKGASVVTDKASDVVGSVLGNNPLMKTMRKAPEGSRRFRFHETLTAGMVAVGKVYVAADEKGRAIVSTAGENGAEVLRERYGDQVAGAARDSTHIGVDAYRIMRFPAKFGASALLKGAAKASLKNPKSPKGN